MLTISLGYTITNATCNGNSGTITSGTAVNWTDVSGSLIITLQTTT